MRASFLLPVKQLMALDFPAFDRPANATSPPESLGHWPIFAALIRKDAARKLSSLEELSCVVLMEHHFFRGFFPYIMPRQLTWTPKYSGLSRLFCISQFTQFLEALQ